VDVYDPLSNTWTTSTPLPTPRLRLAATVVEGKLYAVGGMVPKNNKRLGTVEVYDPATNRWTSLPPLPTPRQDLVLVAVGRTLYAIGGNNEKGTLGVG
jgi:serine/threonine-protein kinase PknK